MNLLWRCQGWLSITTAWTAWHAKLGHFLINEELAGWTDLSLAECL